MLAGPWEAVLFADCWTWGPLSPVETSQILRGTAVTPKCVCSWGLRVCGGGAVNRWWGWVRTESHSIMRVPHYSWDSEDSSLQAIPQSSLRFLGLALWGSSCGLVFLFPGPGGCLSLPCCAWSGSSRLSSGVPSPP